MTDSGIFVLRAFGELSFRSFPSPEAIAVARGRGFQRIGLCGLHPLLDTPEGARTLAEAGVTDVHLSLHGPHAELHDHVAGEGSHAATLTALDHARAAGLTVVVSSALTRSTARSLGALPSWLTEHGVAGWLVEVPRVGAHRGRHFDATYPRLALAVPHALHAIEQSRRMGLLAWVRGVPWCLLGPYVQRALPEVPRTYDVRCEGCVARPRCSGVDAAYLTRFAGDELSAARVRPAATRPVGLREAAVARMFAVPFAIPPLVEE